MENPANQETGEVVSLTAMLRTLGTKLGEVLRRLAEENSPDDDLRLLGHDTHNYTSLTSSR